MILSSMITCSGSLCIFDDSCNVPGLLACSSRTGDTIPRHCNAFQVRGIPCFAKNSHIRTTSISTYMKVVAEGSACVDPCRDDCSRQNLHVDTFYSSLEMPLSTFRSKVGFFPERRRKEHQKTPHGLTYHQSATPLSLKIKPPSSASTTTTTTTTTIIIHAVIA